MTRLAAYVVVAIALFGLYFGRLGDVPLGMHGDEAWFAIHAKSIATSGHDLNGVPFPLFVQPDPELGTDLWFQPISFYLIAASFTVLSVSEWAARLPMAALGVVCVGLTYAVAKQVHGRRDWAAAAAGMMALTPSLLVFSRQAVDYLCPVPFVMGWLWCVLRFLETLRPRFALGAGVLLGVGLYTHISAWMMMPIFFALTCASAIVARRPWLAAGSAAGFVPAFAVLIGWLWWHPGVLPTILQRYEVADSSEWLHAFLRYYRLLDLLRDYWACFNPVNMFFVASGNPIHGTHLGGMFTAPLLILLPAGALVLVQRADRLSLLLAGFLLAPVATAVNRTPGLVERELLFLPFGVLIASVGLRALMERQSRRIRAFAVVLIVAIPVHFAIFAVDYFTLHNRVAFARRDSFNFHELSVRLADLDAARRAPVILLAFNPGKQKPIWTFHMDKPVNASLRVRSRFFSDDSVPNAVPADGLVVVYDATVTAQRVDALRRDCDRVGVVQTADSTLSIWRRR